MTVSSDLIHPSPASYLRTHKLFLSCFSNSLPFTMYTLYNLSPDYQIVEIFHILQLFWCMIICSVGGWMSRDPHYPISFHNHVHSTESSNLNCCTNHALKYHFVSATTITKCCKSCTMHHARYKLFPDLLQHDTSASVYRLRPAESFPALKHVSWLSNVS